MKHPGHASHMPSSFGDRKYMDTIYYCHGCNGTLDSDMGGKTLGVLDMDLLEGGGG